MAAAFPDITPELKAAMPELRGRLLAIESLAPLTWFRVGGPAPVLFTPAVEDDLAYFRAHLSHDIPVYVVGVDTSIVFTSARCRGRVSAPEAIRARMNEVQTHRETAQPIREKTGGSTFKNPPGASAWKLIDAAGCRGLRVGGAQVSDMHCNFLINTGTATGHDIETLGDTVRVRAQENSGIELHWEIKRIGIAA